MTNLLCINSPFTNPYLNLATEEYLLKNFDADIFMLYINEPVIIIGKHQNTFSEINVKHIRQKNIPVVRRLSGGGTVYHDLGNLNFAWIVQAEKNKPVNFDKYINDIYLFLKSLNINVSQTKNNDLSIEGKKISGNAEHIFKNRLIHHGTLLYNSNLSELNKAISANTAIYLTKAVPSKRTNTVNIIDYMKKKGSINYFQNTLLNFIKNRYAQSVDYKLSLSDKKCIHQLASDKYTKWEWNFAYSPKYLFKKNLIYDKKTININFSVQKGIISDFEIETKLLDKNQLNNFTTNINGLKHHWDSLNKVFSISTYKHIKQKMGIADLNDLFF